MIHIDDTDPEGTVEPSFPPRNVQIKRGAKAEELYELISEIGRGKFGTVYKCREKTTGLKLAAKFVPIPKREDRRNVEREVEIMNSLQHHLIIQLYAAYEYQKMMCVVLELVEGGELFDRVIDDDFILTERVCTVFMRQVCEAMQFIHRNNILHLDLKPENILCLTKEGNRIKIIDFGLARKYDPEKKLQVLFGTPEFVAPEVVNFDCISYSTDMWSVGVICYVLLSGLSPFMGENDLETMANVTVAKYDFDDEAFNNVSPEALDFITKLLVKDINERMSATECLEHKWLERRLRPPPIPPKPSNLPPPKYVEKITPPSPTPPPVSTTSPLAVEQCNKEEDTVEKELDTTKDNLKTFIERWEEHPNSPYVFDTEANLIAPLVDASKKGTSTGSSRGYSPSPCASITSVSDELFSPKESSPVKLFNEDIINSNKNLHNNSSENSHNTKNSEEFNKDDDKDQQNDISTSQNFRDYLQSFNRRNSDTNYVIGKRPTGERINLADEIRKLSDHLLMLAEINTKLERENQETIIEEESTSKQMDEEQVQVIEEQQKKLEKQQHEENDNNDDNDNNNNNNNSSDVSINNKNLHQDNKIEENNNVEAHQRRNSNENNNINVTNNNKIPDKLKKTKQGDDRLENILALEMKPNSVINQEKEISLKEDSKSRWEKDTKQKLNSSLSAHLQALEETPIIRQSTVKTINKIEEQQDNTKSVKREENLRNTTATGTTTTTTSNTIIEERKSLQYSDFNGIKEYSSKLFETSSKFINDSNNNNNNNNNSSSSSSEFSFTNFGSGCGVPWPITNRRIKFKINQMSRDVPIGLPNKHQSFNLEETASTTKDCLLHLLEKYTMTRNRTINGSGRHQSISVDWNMAENLENRSMSSINAFFQRHTTNGNHINKVRAKLEAKSKN